MDRYQLCVKTISSISASERGGWTRLQSTACGRSQERVSTINTAKLNEERIALCQVEGVELLVDEDSSEKLRELTVLEIFS